MINFYVKKQSKDRLFLEIRNKIDGMQELKSVQTKNLLMSAAFSKASLEFIAYINMKAKSNPRLLGHVYEWDEVGQETGRLFRLFKKQNSGGTATIYYKFNNSKKKSPIADVLKQPGSTGKSVVRSGVFKRKAEVMESGKPVSFVAKRNIAFSPDKKSIIFKREGTKIVIKNPGGVSSTGAFYQNFYAWWKAKFPHILTDSKAIPDLEKNVARALTAKNAGRAQARTAIEKTLRRYIITRSVV